MKFKIGDRVRLISNPIQSRGEVINTIQDIDDMVMVNWDMLGPEFRYEEEIEHEILKIRRDKLDQLGI